MDRLQRSRNVADLRRRAARRLPRPIWEFLEGGADDEWSVRENRAAFGRWALVPRAAVDVRRVDLATRALGLPLDLPVALAPTGMTRMYHSAGEAAVARAAAQAGALYALSTYSSQPLEDVAAAAAGPKMFQLFTAPGWERSLELVDRAKAAGYDVLCLTVDTSAPSNKERDLATGLARGRLSPRSIASIAAHPHWVLSLLRGGPLRLANLDVAARDAEEATWREADRLTWEHVARIRERWPGPFALKGVLRAQDAVRAAELGVDAVIASNHGGRQLDGVPASIDCVSGLVDAAGDRLEVWVDSGIRRGTDVLKALALGARLCLVGRPYLYGLVAGGEAGVARTLAIFREELARDMKLLGVPRLADLDRSFVTRAAP